MKKLIVFIAITIMLSCRGGEIHYIDNTFYLYNEEIERLNYYINKCESSNNIIDVIIYNDSAKYSQYCCEMLLNSLILENEK